MAGPDEALMNHDMQSAENTPSAQQVLVVKTAFRFPFLPREQNPAEETIS